MIGKIEAGCFFDRFEKNIRSLKPFADGRGVIFYLWGGMWLDGITKKWGRGGAISLLNKKST